MSEDDGHRAWAAMRDALRGSDSRDLADLRLELMHRIASTRAGGLAGLEVQARLLAELTRPESLAEGNLERLLVVNIAASLAALLAASGLG